MANNNFTKFLDVSAISELTHKVGLRELISLLIEEIRSDYLRWEEFEKTPRTANHSKLGVIELMPISDHDLYSFKYVNGHPYNPKNNLLTVMAFGVLAEMSSGYPILISEMTILTALRTAATSALAALEMARKDSSSMAMIGNGAQSEFQILAFNHALGIKTFKLYDIDFEATEKLVKNLSSDKSFELIPCSTISEAAEGVDIITTCTADKKKATILELSHVKKGMHINAIGGDCPGKTELAKEILEQSRVVVEYAPQTRIEGDIQQMSADFPVIELHEVLDKLKKGRESDQEITVFDSVGFSLEDFSTLRLINSLSEIHKIGSKIDIIPGLNNVKDLYSRVK